ncbi:hypothetical protein ABE021_13595 [Sporosarcina gallistercoris]|uniref:hypothetical protein n=1 Tax=Sporosarcina gallistercoris TaxID=2762245 RepID=UPI003D2C71BC
MNTLLKNKTAFTSIIFSLIAMLTLSVILPGFATKASASSIESTGNEALVTDLNLLQESLEDNPNFLADLEKAKGLYYSSIGLTYKDEVQARGVVTAPLKALKALGVTVKHGGTALSWLLKPFSKKYSVLVKRYSRQISNVLAKPENGSKAYIEKQLIKAGVPKSDAKTLVYWIFMVV